MSFEKIVGWVLGELLGARDADVLQGGISSAHVSCFVVATVAGEEVAMISARYVF
jgi:hypothetical protein